MTNWKEYKLGDICSKIGSGATPKGGADSYLQIGEFALIRSQNVLDFTLSRNGLVFINHEQASKLNNVELFEGDILLNITVSQSQLLPVKEEIQSSPIPVNEETPSLPFSELPETS